MYAFGITLFEVFACAEPYAEHPDALSVLQRVADTAADPPFRPALPAHTPPLFRELCRRCWHPEPAARPSFAQIAIEIKTLDMPELSRALFLTRQGHKRMDILQDRQTALIQKVFPARVAAQLLENKQVRVCSRDNLHVRLAVFKHWVCECVSVTCSMFGILFGAGGAGDVRMRHHLLLVRPTAFSLLCPPHCPPFPCSSPPPGMYSSV